MRLALLIILLIQVQTYLRYAGVAISATMHFNDVGELTGAKYRFSTRVGNHQEIDGYKLPPYGRQSLIFTSVLLVLNHLHRAVFGCLPDFVFMI
jgi:hypothetical protein